MVLSRYRSLGRLKAAIKTNFPGVLDQLWEHYVRDSIVESVFGPPLFRKRAMLLYFSVLRPNYLPVYLLGKEDVSSLVIELHSSSLAEFYRANYASWTWTEDR